MHAESLSKAGGQYTESEQIEVLCSFIRFFIHNATLSILCRQSDINIVKEALSVVENVKRNSPQIPLVFLVNECTIVEDEFKITAKNNQNKQWPVLCSYSCCQFLFIYLFRMFSLFLWFDSESKSNWSKDLFKENIQ